MSSVGDHDCHLRNCKIAIRHLLTMTGLLNGMFPEYDEKCRKTALRRYAGLTAAPTAVPRPRVKNICLVTDPLEEDGMKYFLPEDCGRVPSIASVYAPLTEYIRGWLWEMGSRHTLSGVLGVMPSKSTGPVQRLARVIRGLLWNKGRYPSFRNSLGGPMTRPLGSLQDLIRVGEGSSDLSFDRLSRLRAVVSPTPRSLEFFLECEDDILESILQTSISSNRITLMIFWIIAAFRCGFREELLGVVSTRLNSVWTFCVRLQSNNVIATTELDKAVCQQIQESDHELEVLWLEVFRGIREARALYREGSSESLSLCSGCGEDRELSPSQARSLVLSTFANGHVDREHSNRIKRAALDS
jgi:hypothetical protein